MTHHYEPRTTDRDPCPACSRPIGEHTHGEAVDCFADTLGRVLDDELGPEDRLIEASSLGRDACYGQCPVCKTERARDPFDDTCVECGSEMP